MKISRFIVMASILFVFTACGAKNEKKYVYYSKRPSSSLYKLKSLTITTNSVNVDTNYVDSDGKTIKSVKVDQVSSNYNLEWTSVDVSWGEKLQVKTKTPLIVKNMAQKDQSEYVKVFATESKKDGFVRASHLVANPIGKGVILNKTILYSKASFKGDSKVVYPTTLVYIMETNNTDGKLWAKVVPIQLWNEPQYHIIRDYVEVPYQIEYWLEYNQISQKKDDIELLVSTMLAVASYVDSKKEANDRIKAVAIIETLMKSYSGSLALVYAQEALETIDPSLSSSSNSISDPEGNPLLDEDLSEDDNTYSDTVIEEDEGTAPEDDGEL